MFHLSFYFILALAISAREAEFDPKIVPAWAEDLSESLLLTAQQHANVKTACRLIKKSCRKQFFQRQVTTATWKSSNLGDSPK